jgi:ion channel
VRHYHGGIADWKEAGLALEPATSETASRGSDRTPILRTRFGRPSRSVQKQLGNIILDWVDGLSTARLFAIWLAVIVACGAAYWLINLSSRAGLVEAGVRVGTNPGCLLTAIYFSFTTATSVGYGDVLPVGAARMLAVAEAVAGLLLFGLLIAKFVSFRQDMLVREIHSVTFEERLARVQTNLHLVVSELLAISALSDDGAARLGRLGPRLETTTLVFASELRTIHGLLYNPQQAPDGPVLGAILANLASALKTLGEVLLSLSHHVPRSQTLESELRTLSELSQEICADCVPQVYAPALTVWMDRIQEAARTIV